MAPHRRQSHHERLQGRILPAQPFVDLDQSDAQQGVDHAYPPEATALKDALASSDAVLFITPEYNRSIPGALKNAIDWASRPKGQNLFDHLPAAVIGASTGQIGTAMAQQGLRGC